MKVLICGGDGSGKDTVAGIISGGAPYVSATRYLLDVIVWPEWGIFSGFIDKEECYNNRHLHREKWRELADAYCSASLLCDGDHTRLMREVFIMSDIYCGLRSAKQFMAGKRQGVFDASIYVDASRRGISGAGCDIAASMCDIVVRNYSSVKDLERRIGWMKI